MDKWTTDDELCNLGLTFVVNYCLSNAMHSIGRWTEYKITYA